ncbi:MAG: Asp-tRNA(Asn)/Glu-tRNA(Gln) amidotransferase subunit GatC [Candidatus Omnitrophica bacterium]|nr:Asp-tRNA(Asn)/Glu-tRNA(Gln) amidotransferase subunit GatC [Candidatus Omnitrophota bacterium]
MKFDIEALAQLARIELGHKEKERLSGDLVNILKYVEQIDELKTDAIEPTSHVLAIENVFREDEIREDSVSARKVLDVLPDSSKDGSFFRVPKVIEGIE